MKKIKFAEVMYMNEKENVSLKKAIDELLETSIFKEVLRRNNKEFAEQLAVWLVRYILVVTSMNESLKIGLEEALFKLHGEKFQQILKITEKTFHTVSENEKYNNYIW